MKTIEKDYTELKKIVESWPLIGVAGGFCFLIFGPILVWLFILALDCYVAYM